MELYYLALKKKDTETKEFTSLLLMSRPNNADPSTMQSSLSNQNAYVGVWRQIDHPIVAS